MQASNSQVGPNLSKQFQTSDPFSCGFIGQSGSINDRVEEWKSELQNDRDCKFLIDGIQNGFRITERDSVFVNVHQKNHPSAMQHKIEVEKELKHQIELGNYVIASKKPTIVSALAAIPKDDGSVRLIHDGSRPVNTAMNDYSIPNAEKFQNLQDACKLAKPYYFMAKIDLQAAYRSVPIHCDDYTATGLQWKFQNMSDPVFIFDTKLPFGSNKGPSHFHRLSQAIRRCMVRRGFNGVVAYIDDFFLAAPTYEECNYWMTVLIRLIRKLGFLISWKKVVGPTQRLTFLGVEIDTTQCTLSLNGEKLEKLHSELKQFKNRKRASKQQLQSIAGKLNWACQAIRGGRFFLRRIIDSIQHLQQQRHKAQLSSEFHADLQWWLSFLHVFNGTVYFSCDKEHVHIDACNVAAGSFWLGKWNYVVFECDMPKVADLHINYKEMSAVVTAVDNWASLWAGKTVIFHTDSTVTKAAINRGWSRNSYVNSLLRTMAWKCAKLNIKIKAVHVPGCLNVIADTISRLHEPHKIEFLLQLLRRWHHGTAPFSTLSEHMSLRAYVSLFDRCRRRQVCTAATRGRFL